MKKKKKKLDPYFIQKSASEIKDLTIMDKINNTGRCLHNLGVEKDSLNKTQNQT